MTETVGCKRGGEIISSQKERERGDFCPELKKGLFSGSLECENGLALNTDTVQSKSCVARLIQSLLGMVTMHRSPSLLLFLTHSHPINILPATPSALWNSHRLKRIFLFKKKN